MALSIHAPGTHPCMQTRITDLFGHEQSRSRAHYMCVTLHLGLTGYSYTHAYMLCGRSLGTHASVTGPIGIFVYGPAAPESAPYPSANRTAKGTLTRIALAPPLAFTPRVEQPGRTPNVHGQHALGMRVQAAPPHGCSRTSELWQYLPPSVQHDLGHAGFHASVHLLTLDANSELRHSLPRFVGLVP